MNIFYFLYTGAGIEVAKAMFGIISEIDVGPVRLPITKLTTDTYKLLKSDLIAFGSVEWFVDLFITFLLWCTNKAGELTVSFNIDMFEVQINFSSLLTDR